VLVPKVAVKAARHGAKYMTSYILTWSTLHYSPAKAKGVKHTTCSHWCSTDEGPVAEEPTELLRCYRELQNND